MVAYISSSEISMHATFSRILHIIIHIVAYVLIFFLFLIKIEIYNQ